MDYAYELTYDDYRGQRNYVDFDVRVRTAGGLAFAASQWRDSKVTEFELRVPKQEEPVFFSLYEEQIEFLEKLLEARKALQAIQPGANASF